MAANSTRARGETLFGSSGTSSASAGPTTADKSTTEGHREAPPPTGPVVAGDGGNARPGGGHSLTVTYGMREYRIMGLEKAPRKLKATVRVEHAGKLHVDTLDFYSAKSRRILAVDLCRIFEETPETIEGDLDKLLRHCEQLPEKLDDAAPIRAAAELMTATERKEGETFGKSPTASSRRRKSKRSCASTGTSRAS
jgi:hypothetical protein